MGLGAILIDDLIGLRRSGRLKLGASVIEIGAQQLSNAFLRSPNLGVLYELFQAKQPFLGSPIEEGFVGGVEIQSESAPRSELFWRSLGMNYAAIEYAGHRDAVSLDLNRDSVPDRWRGKFDLVVNAGTTEHVANQDNAFRVIHNLAAPNGIMIHDVPGGGMMAHGLFNYNLKFFWMLCRENNYSVIKLKVTPVGPVKVSEQVIVSNLQWAGSDACGAIQIYDFGLVAVLAKTKNRPFVTPLDTPASQEHRRNEPVRWLRQAAVRLRSGFISNSFAARQFSKLLQAKAADHFDGAGVDV